MARSTKSGRIMGFFVVMASDAVRTGSGLPRMRQVAGTTGGACMVSLPMQPVDLPMTGFAIH